MFGPLFNAGASVVLHAVDSFVANGAGWLLQRVMASIQASGAPRLGAAWFLVHYKMMGLLSAVIVVPLVCLAAIQAIVEGDPALLGRTVLVRLPMATGFGLVAMFLVQAGLAACDAISAAVATGTQPSGPSLLSSLAGAVMRVTGPGLPGVPGFVVLVIVAIVAFGAFMLWVEMMLRMAAIYAAVLFLPLCLAGLVWPPSSRLAKRLGETIAALLLAKVVIVIVISVAIDAVGSGLSPAGPDGLLAGACLLVLAALAPYSLLKLVPVIEAGAVAHLEGVSRSGTGAARRTAGRVIGLAAGMAGPGGTIGAAGFGEGLALMDGVELTDDHLRPFLDEQVARLRQFADVPLGGEPGEDAGWEGGGKDAPGPEHDSGGAGTGAGVSEG
ncbi:MAG: hypothetical protein ACYDH5_00110 [Acidimicrobiales bacterium]